VIADALNAQAVDDAIDLFQGDHAAGFDALLHRRPVGRFHTDDLDLGVRSLERHCNAGDQSAAADRHHGHVDLGKILTDLQAQCSLAGDELHVVEGMDVCQPALLAELLGFLVGFVPNGAVLHYFGAVGAGGVDL